MNWSKHFDERQQKEIASSQMYVRDMADDMNDNAKLIIAKMADILNEIESVLLFDNMDDNEVWDHLHRIMKTGE